MGRGTERPTIVQFRHFVLEKDGILGGGRIDEFFAREWLKGLLHGRYGRSIPPKSTGCFLSWCPAFPVSLPVPACFPISDTSLPRAGGAEVALQMILAHWLKSLAHRNRSARIAVRSDGAVNLRRIRRRRSLFVAADVESLEDRVLLSAVAGQLDTHGKVLVNGVEASDHGVIVTNTKAAGKTAIDINSSTVSQYAAGAGRGLSNNANGSGLYVNLDNSGGTLNTLKSLTVTGVTVANNGNAGIQINLKNIALDKLVIDQAVVTGNGGAGLLLNFTNVSIGQLIIFDSKNPGPSQQNPLANAPNSGLSRFTNNKSDGVYVTADTLNVTGVMRIAGNVADGNGTGGAGGTGMWFNLIGANLANVDFNDNEVGAVTNANLTPAAKANASSGVFFDFNRTNITTGQVIRNTLTGNGGHGMAFVSTSVQNGAVTATPSTIGFSAFSDNTFQANGGSGLGLDLQAQTVWQGTLWRNTFRSNVRLGLSVVARDTVNAYDIVVGGLAIDQQTGKFTNANTFENNVGAAISFQLVDTNDNVGDTTGRFRIYGNSITGTTAIAGTYGGLTYRGEGISVRGIGRDDKKNGAARFFGSVIDRNTISGNAGDGVRAELTADSEMLDLMIGNSAGVNQTFDVNGPTEPNGEDVPSQQGNGNVITANGGNGIEIIRSNTAFVSNTRILDNQITGNAGDGLFLQAANSYQTLPTSARPNLKVVTDFTIEDNDLSNNSQSGVHLHTEIDAVMRADLRYNRIDSNSGNGIRLSGRENSTTDFENIGGTWVKNAITNNGQNGVAIENVVGSVNPLVIGREGKDTADKQSLGNYISGNAQSGIYVSAKVYAGGLVVPRDVKDGAEIVNNLITGNGTAAAGDPYQAGKGIDIEVLESQPREFRIDHNVVRGNFGDGIELENRGGQLRFSGLANTIEGNGGRGLDLLNHAGAVINTDAEGYVRFGDTGNYYDSGQLVLDDNGQPISNRNLISGNSLEGVYVVNTLAPLQTQDVSATTPFVTESRTGYVDGTVVNLALDVDTNDIRGNGSASPLSGTGLVVFVGTQNSATRPGTVADIGGTANPFTDSAAAGVGTNTIVGSGSVEAGYRISANGRVNARVVDNNFAGNAGDDVFFQSFVSAVPRPTAGVWTDPSASPAYRIDTYDRDPLARLNLVFTGNTGDSLDVARVGAYFNNDENDFKRRTPKTAPNPSGPFQSGTWERVAQRVADRPVNSINGMLDTAYPDTYSGIFSSSWGAPFGPPNTPQSGFGNTSSGTLTADPSVTDEYGAIVVTATSRSGGISDVKGATVNGVQNVAVISSVNHGLNTGDRIYIESVGGVTSLNNGPNNQGRPEYWVVEKADNNTFQVKDPITGQYVLTNGATYTNGGRWTLVRGGFISNITGTVNTGPAVVTIAGHGLNNGDNITIVGVNGDTAVNNGIVPTVAITGASNANPTVITSAKHGLTDGEQITISGALGNTAINGTWVVANATTDTFELRDIATNNPVAGNGNYIGGASWRRSYAITAATNASPSLISSPSHGLTTGEWVSITGAQGNTNINGIWVVQVLDPDTFVLKDPVTGTTVAGNAAYTGGARWSRANPMQWTVEVVDANTIRLRHPNTNALVLNNAAYAGGGQWGGGLLGSTTLQTGDVVSISGTGIGAVDGTHVVRRLSTSSFSLYVPNSTPSFATFGGTIASALAASPTDPVVLTSPGHGLTTGDKIMISGAGGSTPLNTDATPANPSFSDPNTPNPSYWLAEVLDANTFELRNPETGAVLLGNGTTYVINSGIWQEILSNTAVPVRGKGTVTAASNTNPVVITSAGNGLTSGDRITISGATGNTAINGTWVVEKIVNDKGEVDIDTFRLRNPFTNAYVVGNGAYTGGATWQLNAGFGGGTGSYILHNPSKFSYDGLGPSTFRIESSWDVSGFRDNGLTINGQTNSGDNFSYGALVGNSITTFGWDTVPVGTFNNITAWIDDATVSETDGVANLQVHLSTDAPAGGVLVRYHTTDGTAKASDGDYIPAQFTTPAQAKTISSAVAETTVAGQAVRITVAGHGLNRGDRIVITGAQGATNLNGTWDVEIVNSSSFRLVDPATGQYVVANGNYVAGSAQFVPIQNYGFVFIPEGQRTATISVPILVDNAVDPDEQFYVDLDRISTGDFVDTRGIVRITEPPHITISNAQVVEGDSSDPALARKMTFTVTLSSIPTTNVAVDWATADLPAGVGHATAGQDYVAASGTLTFPAGDSTLSRTFTVDVLGDTLLEGNETFAVNLSNSVNGVIDTIQGIGTIIDNDTPDVSVNDITVDEGVGTASFTVSLSKKVNVPVTVQYTIASGTATSGSDFTAAAGYPLTGQVVIPANTLSVPIKVNIVDDSLLETDETFTVTLTGATNGTIVKPQGVATIKDNDSPTVTIGNAVVTEGDAATGPVATFTLTLDKTSSTPVSVNYATMDYTAAAGSDYVAKSGTVTFAAGQRTATISVGIIGDLLPESFEQYFVVLSNPAGVTIGGAGYGVGGIIDDDTPVMSAADVSMLESDGQGTFTVRLSKAIASPVTVSYSVTSGTAISGQDFFQLPTAGSDPLSGTLTFAPGETVKTITIGLTRNDGAEPTENLYLNLGGATNATLATTRVQGRIIDEQNSLVGFVVGPNAGLAPRIRVYDAKGNARVNPEFLAYSTAFTNGVRVATGDVDGDGSVDIVVAPVRGIAPIRVFRGDTYALEASFFPFSQTYSGGVSIAVGDIDPLNHNGAEIFAATASGDNAVGVFRVSTVSQTATRLSGFYAFGAGLAGSYLSGINVAAADIGGQDGVSEVVVGVNGGTIGPVVRVLTWSGAIVSSFYAFDPSYTGGINVAAGDMNGDGSAEVVASLRAGNPPAVRVLNGLTGAMLNSFYAYSPSFLGGVNVGVADVNLDGKADILTATASQSATLINDFNGLTGQLLLSGVAPYSGSFTGGAFVAGQTFGLPVGSALQLAGSPGNNPGATGVTQSQAQTLAKAAIDRLAAAGASAADLAKLATVKIVVADLPQSYLGESVVGTIVIDVNAAGLGWFIDTTPNTDEEYARDKNGVYRAIAPRAVGKVDLLTVLTHELAHQIGFEDVAPEAQGNSLMTATVPTGVRRATKEQLDDLFADHSMLGELLTV